MRNRPDAAELLAAAERTLASETALDPAARQRYNVAMAAAAVGIARREIAGGPTAWPDELPALEALYGEAPGDDAAAALGRLNRRFAADLRRGAFEDDGDAREKAKALLRNDVLARLAEDNPRYVR